MKTMIKQPLGVMIMDQHAAYHATIEQVNKLNRQYGDAPDHKLDAITRKSHALCDELSSIAAAISLEPTATMKSARRKLEIGAAHLQHVVELDDDDELRTVYRLIVDVARFLARE